MRPSPRPSPRAPCSPTTSLGRCATSSNACGPTGVAKGWTRPRCCKPRTRPVDRWSRAAASSTASSRWTSRPRAARSGCEIASAPIGPLSAPASCAPTRTGVPCCSCAVPLGRTGCRRPRMSPRPRPSTCCSRATSRRPCSCRSSIGPPRARGRLPSRRTSSARTRMRREPRRRVSRRARRPWLTLPT
jgi:hypothetical protein